MYNIGQQIWTHFSRLDLSVQSPTGGRTHNQNKPDGHQLLWRPK